MAELRTLARPYAKAIFELARDEKRLPDWSAFLASLANAVRDPEVAAAIGHPAVGRAELAEVLIAAMGDSATEPSRNLLRLLAENRRLRLAPAIAEQYEALRADHEATVDVEIVTAAPVEAGQQKVLLDAIKKKLQREVHVKWKTDPALIAGAEIRAGDTVIDGSFAGELERLRQALTA